jgi:putative intracellular protease/amidase
MSCFEKKRRRFQMVYILLGNGFETMEALAPCDVLRRAGVRVQLVSVGATRAVATISVNMFSLRFFIFICGY